MPRKGNFRMSEIYAQMLTEKRANVWEQAKALLDTAAGEKRELSAEEQASYDKMGEDLRGLKEKSDNLIKARDEERAFEESMRTLAALPQSGDLATKPGKSAGDQLRAALRGAAGADTSSVEFKPGKGETHAEVRALSKLTAGAGANTVPTTFYGKLWANLILTANLINAGATVWTTDSGESIQVPITTSHSTAALVAEAGTLGQSDPVFGQRSIGAYKYGLLLKISRELLDDTGVDIEGYIAMEAGRAVGNALGADLVAGNGTAKPTGILNNTTLGVTGGAGVVGSFTFDNIIDLFYSVIPNYRNSPEAAWLFNDTSVGVARKLKDSQNRYLWEPSLVAGTPDTILNKPVLTDPNIPATALSAKSVVFGDISRYLVRMVNGVRFEKSIDFSFDSDLITYRCIVRGDGILIDQTGAVKHFIGNAA